MPDVNPFGHPLATDQAPWEHPDPMTPACHCGNPATQSLAASWLCEDCHRRELGRLRLGRPPTGTFVAIAPGWPEPYANLVCPACGATWIGPPGEECSSCATTERLRETDMATARSTTERTVTESSRINERITELATRYRAQPIARNGNGKGAVIRIVDDDHPPDDHPPDDSLPQPINWHELYQRDVQVEWLVPDFWPVGRQLHLHAPKKSGKSLVMFWIVANLARGRDPFTGRPTPPVTVGYCDYEMTPDDVLERAEAMGFVPDDLANLKYYLLPTLPPLDTPHGGDALIKLLHRDGVQAVVLDTLSRVVAGEENSNDTVQNFYRYTGVALKRHDIALARLDHEGHETGRSRGASTKTEDVDVVWQISPTDTGIDLVRKATRVPWIPDRINLHRTDDPLTFRRVGGSWPPGTIDKAAELDRIGVPDDASYRTARKALTDHGLKPGRNDLIRAALKFRRERSDDHD